MYWRCISNENVASRRAISFFDVNAGKKTGRIAPALITDPAAFVGDELYDADRESDDIENVDVLGGSDSEGEVARRLAARCRL